MNTTTDTTTQRTSTRQLRADLAEAIRQRDAAVRDADRIGASFETVLDRAIGYQKQLEVLRAAADAMVRAIEAAPVDALATDLGEQAAALIHALRGAA